MDFTKYHIAGKDYIFCADETAFGNLTKTDIENLCHRQKGVGADGIFTFYQVTSKTAFLKGFAENGEIMRDFSSASICAVFELFSKGDITEYTFSAENGQKITAKTDISAEKPIFSCTFEGPSENGIFREANRKTEIGNRILTITPISLHGTHAVHFSECKKNLNLGYLGQHISENSLFRKEANMILADMTNKNTFDISFYENKTGCPRPVISALGGTALAACRNGLCRFGEEITVSCNGNTVNVICHSPKTVTVKCTCEKVFDGKTSTLFPV